MEIWVCVKGDRRAQKKKEDGRPSNNWKVKRHNKRATDNYYFFVYSLSGLLMYSPKALSSLHSAENLIKSLPSSWPSWTVVVQSSSE